VFLPFQYPFSSVAIEWEAADLGAVGVEAGAGGAVQHRRSGADRAMEGDRAKKDGEKKVVEADTWGPFVRDLNPS